MQILEETSEIYQKSIRSRMGVSIFDDMTYDSFWSHNVFTNNDDVIKLKHFPRYWPFEQGIHRPPVASPHEGQWHGALIFSLICARTNGWANTQDAGDLRRHHAHYDVTWNPFCGNRIGLHMISSISQVVRKGPARARYVLNHMKKDVIKYNHTINSHCPFMLQYP